ncbi:hypothetical protein NQZ79_g4430 [Umbelopsis isabellina]|nr:hypothetical protein NQZ79_g4430 [Umbelopsis isabellina]
MTTISEQSPYFVHQPCLREDHPFFSVVVKLQQTKQRSSTHGHSIRAFTHITKRFCSARYTRKRYLAYDSHIMKAFNLQFTPSAFNSATPLSMQPTQRLLPLSLPELLTHIFQFLDKDNALYPALLVNKEWHDCASRVLWKRVIFEDSKESIQRYEKFARVFGDWQKSPEQLSTTRSMPYALDSMARGVITGNGSEQQDINMMMPQQQGNGTEKGRGLLSFATFEGAIRCIAPQPRRTQSDRSLKRKIVGDFTDFQARSAGGQGTSTDSSVFDLEVSSPKHSDRYTISNIVTYRKALRNLSLRKIKEKSINESLCAIAKHATNLTNLDIYICDHLEDETVIRFTTFHITPSTPISSLTHISLAGCHRITDASVIAAASHCPHLEHLDLRACGLVSDVSISAVALNCPRLRHLNVGRIRDRERITITSIRLIAQRTKAAVLGLAGCDITDECMLLLAQNRKSGMERISVNNCYRITNESIRAFVKLCPRLSVFEMKECHLVNDWASVAELVNRKVLLTLCEQQNKACLDWAKSKGKSMKVRAPVK